MEWQYASLREALGKTLLELGGEVPNMLVVNADLRNSVKTIYFMNKYPERTIEVGIAEQNMIGVAAGLSMMGFIPFCVTFARFASKRAADQISMSVDYCQNNVRIIGAYAGIFTGLSTPPTLTKSAPCCAMLLNIPAHFISVSAVMNGLWSSTRIINSS